MGQTDRGVQEYNTNYVVYRCHARENSRVRQIPV